MKDTRREASQSSSIPLTVSPDGRYAAAYRSRSLGTSRAVHADDEIIYLLEGRVRITLDEGRSPLDVIAGEAIYVPGGSMVTWEVHSPARELAVLRAA